MSTLGHYCYEPGDPNWGHRTPFLRTVFEIEFHPMAVHHDPQTFKPPAFLRLIIFPLSHITPISDAPISFVLCPICPAFSDAE